MSTLVSVIIPTRNRCALLTQAIDSVLMQTYRPIEIIIVDDGSTDETPAFLQALAAKESCIQVITNQQAGGGSQARNIGIRASRGEWISFLDDDDTWLPNKITEQLRALKATENSIACFCAYTLCYTKVGMRKKIIRPPVHINYQSLLKANNLGGTSVCMVNALILKKCGGFDEKLQSAQDWDLWLKLAKVGALITLQQPLVNYKVHFNLRISNNMQAKYNGARRFYFKYQFNQDLSIRQAGISFICYVKSRQKERSLRMRLHHLRQAVAWSDTRTALRYILSSMPRLLLDGLSR